MKWKVIPDGSHGIHHDTDGEFNLIERSEFEDIKETWHAILNEMAGKGTIASVGGTDIWALTNWSYTIRAPEEDRSFLEFIIGEAMPDAKVTFLTKDKNA